MLYRETANGFEPWQGEAIADVRHPVNIEQLWSEGELAAIGLFAPAEALPLPEGKVPDDEPYVDRVAGVVRWVQPYKNAPVMTLAERRDGALPRLAQKRWEVETGGMMFAGMPIPTDDRSKLLIFASRTRAMEDASAVKRWKIQDGVYVELDAQTAIALGDALELHVTGSFAREEAVAGMILAAKSHAAMDAALAEIETGW